MRRYSAPIFPTLATLVVATLCATGCADTPDAAPDAAAADTSQEDTPREGIGRAGTAPALGPADGDALPATDTGRVAVGDTAPDFTLLDRSGEPVTLSELRGRRIILAFYRGHW